MRPPAQRPGFTLPETLVALVLFMMAIGVLASAANNALNSMILMEYKEGRENDLAYVRRQVLAAASKDDLSVGGDVDLPSGSRTHWTAEYEMTETADLFKVMFTADLPATDELPAITANQTLYMLRPSWSEAADRTNALSILHEELSKTRTTQAWP